MTSLRAQPGQVRAGREIIAWYLKERRHSAQDLGTAAMYCDRDLIGHFASPPAALRAGEPGALFKALVATTVFQRRQDQQVLRILRSLTAEQVEELTNPTALLAAAEACPCEHTRSNAALQSKCDLRKDPASGKGNCDAAPRVPCALKRHTVWLRRYGHFGKVPTSLALMLKEVGVDSVPALVARVTRSHSTKAARTASLKASLSAAWRVSEKISAMYLSALSATSLSKARGPWTRCLDGERLLVIDSNVDAFLARIGYRGPWTYSGRSAFLTALADAIDLKALDPRLPRFSPRLLQQALYAFMSRTNRRADPSDCSKRADACRRCPLALRRLCPLERA